MGRKSLEELLEEVKETIDNYYDAVIETKKELEEIKNALNNIDYELETGVKESIQNAIKKELSPVLRETDRLHSKLESLLWEIESKSRKAIKEGATEVFKNVQSEIYSHQQQLDSYIKNLNKVLKQIKTILESFSSEVYQTVEKNRKALLQQFNLGTNLIAFGIGVIFGFLLVGGITWYFFIRPMNVMKEALGSIPGAKIVADGEYRWLYIPGKRNYKITVYDKQKGKSIEIDTYGYEIYIPLELKHRSKK